MSRYSGYFFRMPFFFYRNNVGQRFPLGYNDRLPVFHSLFVYSIRVPASASIFGTPEDFLLLLNASPYRNFR